MREQIANVQYGIITAQLFKCFIFRRGNVRLHCRIELNVPCGNRTAYWQGLDSRVRLLCTPLGPQSLKGGFKRKLSHYYTTEPSCRDFPLHDNNEAMNYNLIVIVHRRQLNIAYRPVISAAVAWLNIVKMSVLSDEFALSWYVSLGPH